MNYLQIILTIAGGVASLGVVAGGLGYLVSVFRGTIKKEQSDVVDSADTLVDFWKQQALDFKEMMAIKEKSCDEKIQVLTREVGELRGQLTEKVSQAERLEQIFQNRNPEMEQFMKYMVQATSDHATFHKSLMDTISSMITLLDDIHTTSANNNVLLATEQNKELKIEGTLTKK